MLELEKSSKDLATRQDTTSFRLSLSTRLLDSLSEASWRKKEGKSEAREDEHNKAKGTTRSNKDGGPRRRLLLAR